MAGRGVARECAYRQVDQDRPIESDSDSDVRSREDWRTWLQAHHDSTSEIWLVSMTLLAAGKKLGLK